MPRQTEPNANNPLGGLLQDMIPRGRVRSENTQAITGQPGLRPDIITVSSRKPVVVFMIVCQKYDIRPDYIQSYDFVGCHQLMHIQQGHYTMQMENAISAKRLQPTTRICPASSWL